MRQQALCARKGGVVKMYFQQAHPAGKPVPIMLIGGQTFKGFNDARAVVLGHPGCRIAMPNVVFKAIADGAPHQQRAGNGQRG